MTISYIKNVFMIIIEINICIIKKRYHTIILFIDIIFQIYINIVTV